MFGISLGFVFPSVFREYGKWAWVVWLLGINAMWTTSSFGIRVFVRLLGVTLAVEVFSAENYLEMHEKKPKITVSERKFTKNGDKYEEKLPENDPAEAIQGLAGEVLEWTGKMLELGYRYVITNTELYDEADKSFTVPHLADVTFDIGDKVAFGSPTSWVGVVVKGSRERDVDTIYYIDPIKS